MLDMIPNIPVFEYDIVLKMRNTVTRFWTKHYSIDIW